MQTVRYCRLGHMVDANKPSLIAVFGCDDLRVFTFRNWIQESVPVYCDLKRFSVLNERFPKVKPR